MNKIDINEPVSVTSLGFRKNMIAYPRRMEFRGKTYDFIDAGLRCLISHGNRIAEIITLSDGTSNFHLRTDNSGGDWTLLCIAS